MKINSSKWVGVSTGALFLIGILLLFGSTVHETWYKMPVEAVNSIAFTLSFGLGFNHFFAYAFALVVIITLFYFGYAIGCYLHKKTK
ncbi:hypothetical protein AND4_10589 [Vibrio sp. AND4]|nr:hypothetical protein AND4_10589 [Vibrio sp. AND4]